jgi:acyl carrier protein
MDENSIRQVIFTTLKAIAPEIEPGDLDLDEPLRDQVDLDSMDFLNFIIGLHEKLGVHIPEADYSRLASLNDLLAYLHARLPG